MFSTHLLPSSDSSRASSWPSPITVFEHILPVILWLLQPCVLLLAAFPFLTGNQHWYTDSWSYQSTQLSLGRPFLATPAEGW